MFRIFDFHKIEINSSTITRREMGFYELSKEAELKNLTNKNRASAEQHTQWPVRMCISRAHKRLIICSDATQCFVCATQKRRPEDEKPNATEFECKQTALIYINYAQLTTSPFHLTLALNTAAASAATVLLLLPPPLTTSFAYMSNER